MTFYSAHQDSAYAEPCQYLVPSVPNPNQMVKSPSTFLQTPMTGNPWTFTGQPSERTKMSEMLQVSVAAPTQPSPTTSNPFRHDSKLEKIRLPPLSDVALHRTYKTVGMRSCDTRCFYCLKEKDHLHRRNWMHCGGLCPACPVHQQHRGSFCPRLCMLRRKESFWMERADLAFADGFNAPTPGLGVVGWKRFGLWMEGASGEKSAQSTTQVSSASSVSSHSTAPSTPVLSSASLTSSPATSVASPLTPVFRSAEAAIMTSSKPHEQSPKLTLYFSSGLIPLSTTVNLGEVHPDPNQSTGSSTAALSASGRLLVLKERGRMEASLRPEQRTRSRSPSKERSNRTYRERSALRPAPVSVQAATSKPVAVPTGRPSLSLFLSDPVFKSIVAEEAVAMVSASFSHHDPQQHAAVDGVLLAVLRAARIAERLGAKDWNYQAGEAMKAYLDYVHKHFPLLMSQSTSGHHISNPNHKAANADIDTYYGKAWRGTREQEDNEKNIRRLFELNEELIEGRPRPKVHFEKRAEYKRYNHPVSEPTVLPGEVRRYTYRDGPLSVPSRPPYDSSPTAKPAASSFPGELHEHSAPAATAPTRTPVWRPSRAPRFLVPRGPARCPWASSKRLRPKKTPVKASAPSPHAPPPPPFTREGTEDGEIIELAKSNQDIMSCLEMQLGVDITEEDWEDLFKGDV